MNSIIQLHREYCNYKITFKGLSMATIRGEYYIIVPFVRILNLRTIKDLQSLEKEDILNYIIKRNKKNNWSARTIKNNIQALHNFFVYCVEKGILSVNPAAGISRPKPPSDLPKIIPQDDALRMLEWLYFAPFRYNGERERAKAIIGMFLFTGVRRGELLNIKNSDVNLKDKVLRINSGKGNKDRLIPINTRLVEILNDYIKSDLKQKSVSMYFFIKLDKKRRMGDGTIRALFKRFKVELGINASPHKLRHTFATLMVKNSCNLSALSKMMGHSDIKTTSIYLWLDVNDLRDQMDKHPFGYVNDLPHN